MKVTCVTRGGLVFLACFAFLFLVVGAGFAEGDAEDPIEKEITKDMYDAFTTNNIYIKARQEFKNEFRFVISIKPNEQDAKMQLLTDFTTKRAFDSFICISESTENKDQSFLGVRFCPNTLNTSFTTWNDSGDNYLQFPIDKDGKKAVIVPDRHDYLDPANRKVYKEPEHGKQSFVNESYTVLIEITDPKTQKLISKLEFVSKYKNQPTDNIMYFTEITIDAEGNILYNPFGITGSDGVWWD